MPKELKPYRPKNVSEAQLYDIGTQKGWVILKKGFPDLACWLPDGRFIFVEVKLKRSHKLKNEQLKMMKEISKYGIPCYRWSPGGGFEKITASTKEPEPRISSWRGNGKQSNRQLFIKPKNSHKTFYY